MVISKMTAFKADFRNNACYGHAHNSCPGRCAVNQITLGNGPDFVMRMGATTYSHHVSMTFTPAAGTTISESFAHTSLQTMLKELKQKLAPKGWQQTMQIDWDNSGDLIGSCDTSLGTFKMRCHLVPGLSLHQKRRLINAIKKAFLPI